MKKSIKLVFVNRELQGVQSVSCNYTVLCCRPQSGALPGFCHSFASSNALFELARTSPALVAPCSMQAGLVWPCSDNCVMGVNRMAVLRSSSSV